VGSCGLDSYISVEVPVVGPCEHGNEPLDFMNGRKFLD